MNRAEVERLLRSIQDHASVAVDMMRDPNLTDRGRELEVCARANYIEARLNALRAEVLRKTPNDSGRPDNVHVLGDPTPGVPAA